MTNRKVNVGIIQMDCVGDKSSNIQKAVIAIRTAADQGANIICLEELFASFYFCNEENYDNFSLAEEVPGPTSRLLGKVARERDVVIIASLFEKRAKGVFHNTVAVLDADGTYLGKYRKHHIPDDPGFYEKFYFTPGDRGYKVFPTKYGKIGTLICWDQWYPEAARITCLMGADILFYPTAIGWSLTQTEALNRQQYQAWQTIQRGHAIANGVYVVAVNRTGTEDQMKFWGGSFIADPFGNLIYQAEHDKEDIHVAEINLDLVDETRVHWPFLRDRRIDSYGPITRRFLDE